MKMKENFASENLRTENTKKEKFQLQDTLIF